MKIKQIDINGKEKGEIKLELIESKDEGDVRYRLHDIIRYQNARNRQGTHSTKTRSQVNGGGAKPYKQKGTGNARRGTSRSPLIAGGGVIFGPTTRSYKYKLNAQYIKKAISTLMLTRNNDILSIDEKGIDKPSTKSIFKLLNNLKIQGKALFVLDNLDGNLFKSCRNLENVKMCTAHQLDLSALVSVDKIIFSDVALNELQGMLS